MVRNLRNPDPKARLNAVRLLREAKYPEAIVPLAPLVNDPVDQIQLEAIAAELSFFLVQDLPERRRVGFVVEVRNRGAAAEAFEQGPLAVWPRPAPPELVTALLKAVDDENARVRLEAIYAAATIPKGQLSLDAEQLLIKALDHYDPVVRAGAARFAGRAGVKAAADELFKLIADSNADVRYASMRALGLLREERVAGDARRAAEVLRRRVKGPGRRSTPLRTSPSLRAPPCSPSGSQTRIPYLRRAAAEGLGRLGRHRLDERARDRRGQRSRRAWRARRWRSPSRRWGATTCRG